MTQPKHEESPLSFPDPEDFGRLRQVLDRADYHEQGVMDSLGVDCRSISEQDLAVLLRRTCSASPLDTFIRLFLIGVSVSVEQTRRAVEPMAMESLIATGLLRTREGRVEGAVRLLPFQGMWLAFDLPPRIDAPSPPDYVMGIGSSSLTLANLTVRRPSRRTLDLGTGCGLLAFLAARHSQRVVAVDRNPRAVHFTAFNARLNDLSNVDCRVGDLFEPVQGERFDLVVSNPPFVISPETRYVYRDSGLRGDQIVEKILRRVPPLLNDGGYCQILCNWAHVAGEDWRDRLASWLCESGCDGWVLRTDTFEPDVYAAKWIRHTERDNAERLHQRFEQWLEYYHEAGIEAISAGLITARRRSGTGHWFRVDDGPERMLGPAGESVAVRFAIHDFLQQTQGDEAFLARRFRVAPDVRLQQSFSAAAEGWCLEDLRLEISRGLAYSGNIDAYVLQWLGRCDGKTPLGAILRQQAEDSEEEPARFTAAGVAVARRLAAAGFLLPVSDPLEASSAGS